MNATPLHSRRRAAVTAAAPAATGFTLIELLTVIAIIAILLAIILPVFATVKENARRTACMSNMQQLYTALRQYELDNRRYPDYLLAPAMVSNGSGGCMTKAINGSNYLIAASSVTDPICTIEQAAGTGLLGGQYIDNASGTDLLPFSGGLYPEYVKSLETYHCPNNTEDLQGADRTNSVVVAAATRAVVGTKATDGTAGSDTPTTQNAVYYRYDSYDANPRIIPGSGKLDTANFTTRYSRLWTRVHKGVAGDALPNTTDANFASYRKQLYWRAPSGDTFVTMCTYHAPKAKVTVLWLSGSAKPIDVKKLQNYNGSDATKPNLTSTDASRDFDTYKLGPGD